METNAISKNEESLKNQMSRGNNKMRQLLLQVLFFLTIMTLSGCATTRTNSLLSFLDNKGVLYNIGDLYDEGWRNLTSDIMKEYDIKLREVFTSGEDHVNYYKSIGEEGTGKNNMVLIRLARMSTGDMTNMYKLKDSTEVSE